MRTWGGRFGEPPDRLAADFSRADEHEQALLADDIVASIAHVRALGRAGVVGADEAARLAEGLQQLLDEASAGRFPWDPALEDVHMNVEAALATKVGPLAGKLHTGRSRNDQVSTDLRLWLRRTLDRLDDLFVGLERALVEQASRHSEAVMPGHTHTQPAQPVLLAHHLLAYVEMLERDRGRLFDTRRRANVCPLGSGALAGAGFPLDRQAVAAELGFDGLTHNSIDASGDRDFAVEALAAFALGMVHLSRLAEEIVWWSTPRLGFVSVADSFSTGSSMMPNKRNPDPAELVRGHSGLVVGQLAGALALLKGLPLGYQRDLQEMRPPLMSAADTLAGSLAVLTGLVASATVDEARLAEAAAAGFTVATALADALVDEGVAFRPAHHIVGQLVRHAESTGVELAELDDGAVEEVLAASPDERARQLAPDPHVTARLRTSATVQAAIERCAVVGGTAPDRVREELAAHARRLGRF